MLEKLWVRGFRNLNNCFIETQSCPHIGIYGPNNQGKTNCLESIYFALTGAGLSNAPLDILVGNGNQNAFIQLLFSHQQTKHVLDVKLGANKRKAAYIDKKPMRSFKHIHSYLITQYVSVETIRVFTDSVDERRKDLDRFCRYFDKDYAIISSQYDRILRQRNKWLKSDILTAPSDIWGIQLISLAYQIVEKRQNILNSLVEKMNALKGDLGLSALEEITSRYLCKHMELDDFSQYAEKFRLLLNHFLSKDRRIGYTSIGPQRDDFHLLANNRWLVQYASRGINQMVAILWKLAQVQLLLATTSASHILLLDDALLELDSTNRNRVMSILSQYAQIIYVTAHPDNKRLLSDAVWYSIKSGTLSPG